MFIVKADEDLFQGFTMLGNRITRLRTIVQNDMELTEEDVERFKAEVKILSGVLEALASETLKKIEVQVL